MRFVRCNRRVPAVIWCEYDPTVDEAPLPRPNPDVVYREMQGEVVLVHLRTNRIYVLNETGARFWQLLDGGSDRGAIHQRLLSEFDVDSGELEREIRRLVKSLSEEGLVS
jgi:hypothetical protein